MWVMQAGVHAQSCLTHYDCMDCSLPGSSIHWMSQARILEWVAISFSKGIVPPQGSNLWLLSFSRKILYWGVTWKGSINNYQLKIQPRHLGNIYQFILSDINKFITC